MFCSSSRRTPYFLLGSFFGFCSFLGSGIYNITIGSYYKLVACIDPSVQLCVFAGGSSSGAGDESNQDVRASDSPKSSTW